MKKMLILLCMAVGAGLAFAQQPEEKASTASPAPVATAVASPSEAAPTPTAVAAMPGDAWDRWVADYNKILKVRKGLEMRLPGGLAYPDPRVKALMQIVDEDDQYVYLRNLPMEDPRSAGYRAWLIRQRAEASTIQVKDFLKDKYFLENIPVEVPPPVTDRITFVDKSHGLPTQGLWQMGFDVADFNHDGRLDLALPPARKGVLRPWVVLNTPQGWLKWETRWPNDVPFDYGDVKVADFDGDGNLDIAIADHFKLAYVLYGDGKGDFTRHSVLPRPNLDVTSRAIAVADFNHDGRPDVVQLAELDVQIDSGRQLTSGLVTVDLNLPPKKPAPSPTGAGPGAKAAEDNSGSNWVVSPAKFPTDLYGDHIVTGDFNGDGLPDILIASHKANNDAFIFINDGDGTSFTPYRSNMFPFQAYVLGVAAGSLDGKKPDQAIIAVSQIVRPLDGPAYTVNAILAYRIADASGHLLKVPERTLIYRDQKSEYNQFRSLAVGDLDGDGRLDIVAGRSLGGIDVLLQMPDGSFALQKNDSLKAGDASPNTLMIRDLDGDGHAELVADFSDGQETPGSVRVWSVVKNKEVGAKKPAAKRSKTK